MIYMNVLALCTHLEPLDCLAAPNLYGRCIITKPRTLIMSNIFTSFDLSQKVWSRSKYHLLHCMMCMHDVFLLLAYKNNMHTCMHPLPSHTRNCIPRFYSPSGQWHIQLTIKKLSILVHLLVEEIVLFFGIPEALLSD